MESTISRYLAVLGFALIMSFGLSALPTTNEAYAKTTDNTTFSFTMPKDGTAATSGRDKKRLELLLRKNLLNYKSLPAVYRRTQNGEKGHLDKLHSWWIRESQENRQMAY